MRFPRVKAEGRSFCHCISRFVHGLFIFGSSGGRCAEAEEFLSLMRRWAAFCGIRILDYVLMANHFHILCEVPEPKPLTQNELLSALRPVTGRDECKGCGSNWWAWLSNLTGSSRASACWSPIPADA